MLPPGELGCDAGRRIRTGRAWRDQCVAASTRGASRYVFTCSSIWLAATRSLTDPLFSVLDGFRVILNSQRTIDESFYSSFYFDLFVILFDVLLFAFYFLICYLSWYDVAALPPGASSAWPSHCAHCGSLSLENRQPPYRQWYRQPPYGQWCRQSPLKVCTSSAGFMVTIDPTL